MPHVVHYSASRASQNMCKEPRASAETTLEFAAVSYHIQEVQELINQAKKQGLQTLSQGNMLYLDTHAPRWRELLPD